MQKHDEAIKDYSNAIVKYYKYDETYLSPREGELILNKHNLEIAVNNKIIELNSKLVETFNSRGLSYAETDKPKKAISDYNTAIKLDSNFAWSYYNLGLIYTTLNKYTEAIKNYSDSEKKGLLKKYYIRRLTYITEYNNLINKYKKYKINFKNITVLLFKLDEAIDKFQNINFYKRYSHYSMPSLLNKLLEEDQTKLRLYLIDNMNDS